MVGGRLAAGVSPWPTGRCRSLKSATGISKKSTLGGTGERWLLLTAATVSSSEAVSAILSRGSEHSRVACASHWTCSRPRRYFRSDERRRETLACFFSASAFVAAARASRCRSAALAGLNQTRSAPRHRSYSYWALRTGVRVEKEGAPAVPRPLHKKDKTKPHARPEIPANRRARIRRKLTQTPWLRTNEMLPC